MEIFLDGVWDTINYYSAGSTNARVVCRQLGYNTYSKILTLDIDSLMYMCELLLHGGLCEMKRSWEWCPTRRNEST